MPPSAFILAITFIALELVPELINNLDNNFYLKSIDNNLISFVNAYNSLKQRLELNSPTSILDKAYLNVVNLEKRLELVNLPLRIDTEKERINLIIDNITKIFTNKINILEHDFSSKLDKLIYINPLNIMKKGYSIIYKDDKVISSTKSVKENDELTIQFHDGENKVKVIK